jgi:metal-responsive CopG/Arc/MetJ family transcriptional regulator
MGSVTSAFSLDIDLHNRFTNFCSNKGMGKSATIQHALRYYLDKEEKREVADIIDCMDDRMLELLKKEIKKRE